jgi:hypothetical protein
MKIVCFCSVPFDDRRGVDPIHAALASAQPVVPGIVDIATRTQEVRSVRINVFGAGHIIPFGPGLLVSRLLSESVTSIAQVHWRRVDIAGAFYLPYLAGNISYRTDPSFDPESSDASEAVLKMADRHACPVPSGMDYLELLWLTAPKECQRVVRQFDDPHVAIRDQRLAIPVDHVKSSGIYWDKMFMCRPDVFEIVAPHVQEPVFTSRDIEV